MVQAMVVFSNTRLGPSAELLVSDDVAIAMLKATAATARPVAAARWEHELVDWLERRAAPVPRDGEAGASDTMSGRRGPTAAPGVAARLDVNDIAWTPDHFEAQRRFLVDAIVRAALGSQHNAAFDRWRHLIEAHPRDSVQVGRRWQWEVTA
jgi:hypothetical protein